MKKLKNIYIIALQFYCINYAISQNVAINTSGSAPSGSAMLDISSSSLGILIPRIALTSITDNTTISSPLTSLLVYNTSTTLTIWPGYYYWNGTQWVRMVSGTGGGFGWNILGNTGTDASINYVGTSDNIDFTFRTNNTERMRISGTQLNFLNNGSSIFIGEGAGALDNLTNNYNIIIGYNALSAATNAEYSIGIGRNSLLNFNTSAARALAIGAGSQAGALTGTNNVSIGSGSLAALTSGSFNSCMGYSAHSSLTIGSSNTTVGSGMGGSNRNRNSMCGGAALVPSSTGSDLIGLGYQVFNSSSTSTRSIALGASALKPDNSADNVCIGSYSNGGTASLAGTNVFIGNLTGGSNSVVGSGNIFIGESAGYNETGNDKLYIANTNTATPLIYGDFSTNRVGINRVPTANNFEISGGAPKTTTANWLANSNRRIKTNIQNIDNALKTRKKLNHVKFKYTDEWKERVPYIKAHDRYYYNFIAQEYKKVFPESVQGSGEYLKGSKKEILQIDTYSSQIVLIKAIQEQQNMIVSQQEKIKKQQAIIDKNKQLIDSQGQQLSTIEQEIKIITKKKALSASKN